MQDFTGRGGVVKTAVSHPRSARCGDFRKDGTIFVVERRVVQHAQRIFRVKIFVHVNVQPTKLGAVY